jgi:hypothetical protein
MTSAIALMLMAVFGGCISGPRYTYVQQPDSARIVGPGVPASGASSGTCRINIDSMDGFAVNFAASDPNSPGIFYGKKPLFCSVGRHVFILDIAQVDARFGEIRKGGVGEVGDWSAGALPTVTADFTANHVYRFTAELDGAGSLIVISLWDETNGASKRSCVAHWTVDGDGHFNDENTFAPVHKR